MGNKIQQKEAVDVFVLLKDFEEILQIKESFKKVYDCQ
jgi:hypothetical protein